MTLAELGEAVELPARTIRFYISRGLVEGPVKSGRGAEYTKEHVTRLERIKKLQAQGRTLSQITRILSGVSEESDGPPPTAWWQHAIADDVVVWVKAGASPWRLKEVRAALDAFARQIGPGEASGKEEGEA